MNNCGVIIINPRKEKRKIQSIVPQNMLSSCTEAFSIEDPCQKKAIKDVAKIL